MAVKRNIVLFEEAKEWGKEDSSDLRNAGYTVKSVYRAQAADVRCEGPVTHKL